MKVSVFAASAVIAVSVLCTAAVLMVKETGRYSQPASSQNTPVIDINWGEGVDVPTSKDKSPAA